LARVVATAEDVWQDREQARRFLTTPHPEIGGKTPIEATLTELGARQAEEVVARIVSGTLGCAALRCTSDSPTHPPDAPDSAQVESDCIEGL